MNKATTGTIADIQEMKFFRGIRRVLGAEVSYTFYADDGTCITTKEKITQDDIDNLQLKVGMKVPIRYNAKKPRTAMIDTAFSQKSMPFELSSEEMGLLESSLQTIESRNAPAAKELRMMYREVRETNNRQVYTEFIRKLEYYLQELEQVTSKQFNEIISQVMRTDVNAGRKLQELSQKSGYAQNEFERKQIEEQMIQIIEQANKEEQEKQLRTGAVTQEILDIAKNGQEAQGVILKSTVTGKYRGDSAEVALKVKVQPKNGYTYETDVIKYVLPESMFATAEGTVLRVFHMPGNTKELAIAFPRMQTP